MYTRVVSIISSLSDFENGYVKVMYINVNVFITE